MQIFIVSVIFIAIDHLLALFKGERIKKFSFYYTISLCAAGVCALIALRAVLYFSLKGAPRLSADTVSWALGRYDMFVTAAAAVAIIAAFALFAALVFMREGAKLYRIMPVVVLCICLAVLVLGIVYSLGTVNADFDIASYIIKSVPFISAILHAPLIQSRHRIIVLNR